MSNYGSKTSGDLFCSIDAIPLYASDPDHGAAEINKITSTVNSLPPPRRKPPHITPFEDVKLPAAPKAIGIEEGCPNQKRPLAGKNEPKTVRRLFRPGTELEIKRGLPDKYDYRLTALSEDE